MSDNKKFERRILLTSELRTSPQIEGLDDDNDDEDRSISGYAARYNSLSGDLGGFRECIAPGAFRDIVKSGADVVALFNHDPNMVLGRVSAGTLKLTDDANGLHFACSLPDNQTGRDLHTSVKRGDVAGCSFSFVLGDDDQDWNQVTDPDDRSQTYVRRTIKAFRKIVDVGPVVFPAYDSTSVSARSALVAQVNVTDIVIPKDFSEAAANAHNERVRRRRELFHQIL